MRKLAIIGALTATSLFAGACGGDGGGGGATVSGRVVDAPVANGQVDVTALDSGGAFVGFLDQVLTDANGGFRANAHRGAMRLDVSSGTFVDPATGETISIGNRQGGMVAYVPGTGSYTVSPFTTLAAERIEDDLIAGEDVLDAIVAQHDALAAAFAAEDATGAEVRIDPIRTVPADLSNAALATQDLTAEKLYAALLAGFAQYAADLDALASPPGAGLITPVELLQQLTFDVRDGAIDGVDATRTTPLNLTISGVPIIPAGKTFGVALGEAVQAVRQSSFASFAGLTQAQAALVADALSTTGDGAGTPIFEAQQPTITAVATQFGTSTTSPEMHLSGGDTITISGTNFLQDIEVFIGLPGGTSVEATVQTVTSTQLTATAAPDTNPLTSDGGLRSVTVKNPGGEAVTRLQAVRMIGAPVAGLDLVLSQSTISVDQNATPISVTASGLTDENGNTVLQNETVDLAVALTPDATAGSGTGPSLSSGSVTTDASGAIAFSVDIGQKPGSVLVSATAASPGTASDSDTFTITPGETASIALASNKGILTADGADTASLSGTVLDQFGNGVADATAIELVAEVPGTADDGELAGTGTPVATVLTSAAAIAFDYVAPTSTGAVGDGIATITAATTTPIVAGTVTTSIQITLTPDLPQQVTIAPAAAALSVDGTGGPPGGPALPSLLVLTGEVRDSQGNLLPNDPITIQTTGPITLSGSGPFTTDAAGAYSITVVAQATLTGDGSAPNIASVRVTAQSGQFATAALTVSPGAVSAGNFSLSAPQEVVAGATETITGVIEDANQNPLLSGTVISLGLANAGSSAPATTTVGLNGAFSFSYTAATSTAANDTITASVTTALSAVVSATADVTIIPGAPARIAIDQVPGADLSADGTAGLPKQQTFTGTVYDAFDNTVAGGHVLDVTLSGPVNRNNLTSFTATTSLVGTFTAANVRADDTIGATGAVAGVPASVAFASQQLPAVSAASTFAVFPGDAATITLTSVPTSLVASATTTITGTVLDSRGNMLTDGTAVLVEQLNGVSAIDGGSGFTTSTTSTTLSAGAFSFTLRAPEAAPQSDTLTFYVLKSDLSGRSAQRSATVSYLVDEPFEIDDVTVSSSTLAVSVDGSSAPQTLSVSGTVRDQFGNGVASKTVQLDTTGDLIPQSATTQTAADGGFSFSFSANDQTLLSSPAPGVAGTATVELRELSQSVSSTPITITVNPGAPATLAFSSQPPATFTASLTPLTITGTVKDIVGNAVLDGERLEVTSVTSTATTTQVFTSGGGFTIVQPLTDTDADASITVVGKDKDNDDIVLGPALIDVVHAAAFDIAITDLSAVQLSVGPPAQTQTVTGTVSDRFGNPVSGASVTLTVGDPDVGTLTIGTSTGLTSGQVATQNGLFTATFVADEQAATTTITASVAGVDASGNPVTLEDETDIEVIEGPLATLALIAPEPQGAFATRLTVSAASSTPQVRYSGTAVDAFGNPVDAALGVAIDQSGTGGVLTDAAFDDLGGTVSATAGTFELFLEQVSVKGDVTITVSGSGASPVTSSAVTFLAGEASVIEAFAIANAGPEVATTQAGGLTGTVKDALGNLVEDGTLVELNVEEALSHGFTASSFSPVQAPTTAGGFSADFTAGTEARAETIKATALGLDGVSQTSATKTVAITVLSGDPVDFTLQAVTAPVNDPPHLTADGVCLIEIESVGQVVDRFGNPIQDSEAVAVTITPTTPGNVDQAAEIVAGTVTTTSSTLSFTVLAPTLVAGITSEPFTVQARYTEPAPDALGALTLVAERNVFQHAVQSASGLPAPIVLVGDVNGDGKLDLVEVTTSSPAYAISFGDGDGGIHGFDSGSGGSGAVRAGTLADVNADGLLDLVLATDGGVRVFTATSSAPHFDPASPADTLDGSVSYVDVDVADFNGDDLVDIAGLTAASVLQVFRGTGVGSVSSTADATSVLNLGTAERFEVGDVALNGFPDIVAVDGTDLYVAVNFGADPVTFGATSAMPLDGSSDLALADIDRDGDLDVVLVRDDMGPVVTVRLNTRLDGVSRYTETFDLAVDPDTGNTLEPFEDVASFDTVQVLDANGDGKPDIAVGFTDAQDGSIGRVALFLQASDATSETAGDDRFVTEMITSFGFEVVPGSRFAIGDLDIDGTPDLAAAVTGGCDPGAGTTGAAILASQEDPVPATFGFTALPPVSAAPEFFRGLATSDALLDGGEDVIVIDSTGAVKTLDFEGTDAAPTQVDATPGGDAPQQEFADLTAADINRDGASDLAYASSGSAPSTATLLTNDGAAGFGQPVDFDAATPMPLAAIATVRDTDGATSLPPIVDVVGADDYYTVVVFDLDSLAVGAEIERATLTLTVVATTTAGDSFDVRIEPAVDNSNATVGNDTTIELADIEETLDLSPTVIYTSPTDGTGDYAIVNDDVRDAVRDAIDTDGARYLSFLVSLNAGGRIEFGTSPTLTVQTNTSLTVVGSFVGGNGPDLAVFAKAQGELRFALNNGDQQNAAFELADSGVDVSSFGPPIRGVAGHFDDDLFVDVAFIAGEPTINAIAVLFGDPFDAAPNGDYVEAFGTRPPAPQITASSIGFTGFRAIAAGDFNEDGTDDLVVAGVSFTTVLSPRDDGSSFPSLATLSHGGSAVTTGDFNGDGKLDIALGQAGTVRIFRGNGSGNFSAPTVIDLELPGGGANSNPVIELRAFDANHDGLDDLAVVQTDQVSVFRSNP